MDGPTDQTMTHPFGLRPYIDAYIHPSARSSFHMYVHIPIEWLGETKRASEGLREPDGRVEIRKLPSVSYTTLSPLPLLWGYCPALNYWKIQMYSKTRVLLTINGYWVASPRLKRISTAKKVQKTPYHAIWIIAISDSCLYTQTIIRPVYRTSVNIVTPAAPILNGWWGLRKIEH